MTILCQRETWCWSTTRHVPDTDVKAFSSREGKLGTCTGGPEIIATEPACLGPPFGLMLSWYIPINP